MTPMPPPKRIRQTAPTIHTISHRQSVCLTRSLGTPDNIDLRSNAALTPSVQVRISFQGNPELPHTTTKGRAAALMETRRRGAVAASSGGRRSTVRSSAGIVCHTKRREAALAPDICRPTPLNGRAHPPAHTSHVPAPNSPRLPGSRQLTLQARVLPSVRKGYLRISPLVFPT